MDNEPTKFALNLKKFRIEQNLSQEDLASKVGLTKQTICAYEHATCGDNKGKNPTLNTAIQISEALHVSLDALCGTQSTTAFDSRKKTYAELAWEIAYMLTADEFGYQEIPATVKTMTASGDVEAYPFPELSLPAIVVKNEFLQDFLRKQQLLFSLYNSGTIKKKEYQSLLEGAIQLLGEKKVGNFFDIDDYQ